MKLATLSTADVRANSLQKQNEDLQVVFKKFEREKANLEADVSSKNYQLKFKFPNYKPKSMGYPPIWERHKAIFVGWSKNSNRTGYNSSENVMKQINGG